MSAPASTSSNDMEYFSNSFEGSTSGFQMNPLSSHPPRTPRASTSSAISLTTFNLTHEEMSVKDETDAQSTVDLSDDEEEKKVQRAEAASRVRKEEVWKEMLTTAYGRDKTFKIMQYSLRLYLLFHTTISASAAFTGTKRSWEPELLKRLDSAISGFSLTRKCLILFNWLAPLNTILAQNSNDPFSSAKTKSKPLLHTFLHTSPPVLLELVNAAADDIYTFSRLGLIGKRTGERAGKFADWCWFVSTLVNLVENSVERSVILEQQHQVESRSYDESMLGATNKSNPTASKLDRKELERLQRQDYWIQLSRLKLLMDLIFVSYNVFRLKRAKSSVQTVTGLAAALLSTAKFYDRHRSALLKAPKL